MLDVDGLADKLKGCPHANVKQIGEEHFTPEFLKYVVGGFLHAKRMAEGLQVTYEPTEVDKLVAHYCARDLIKDLWEFAIPKLRDFVKPDGRFDLEKGFASGDYGSLTEDLTHNFDIGRKMIYWTNAGIYDSWVQNLHQRYRESGGNELVPIMFQVYQLHSASLNGGDLGAETIMNATFTRAGQENFAWLADHPPLTRQQLEEIAENSIPGIIEFASKLAINSTAREEVVNEAESRGERPYVLDFAAKKVILDPNLCPEIEGRETSLRQDGFYDKTQMLLMCPAKFAPGGLYDKKGSMLHDLIRFRNSVFVEIYLSTHNMR